MKTPEEITLEKRKHLDDEIEKERFAIAANEPAIASFAASHPSIPMTRHQRLSELLHERALLDSENAEEE